MTTATAPISMTIRLGLDPARLRMAARTAAAAAISLCLVFIYRFPNGYWALITCLIMTQPSVGASMEKGALRIVGTIGASLIAILVLAPLNQNPLPFLALTFAIVAVGAYLGTGTVVPYTFVIGGITVVMVSALGFSGQNATVQVGIARSGEIIVGVVVSWLVAYALWPTRASLQLEANTRRAIDELASAFDLLANAFLEHRHAPPDFLSKLDAASTAIRQQVALIPPATRESPAVRRGAAAHRALTVHLARLRASLRPLADFETLPASDFLDELRGELTSLVAAIDRGFRALASRTYETTVSEEIAAAREAVSARHDVLRRSGATGVRSTQEIIAFESFLGSLREVESSIAAAGRAMLEQSFGPRQDEIADLPPAQSSFRFSLDERRAKYAIKSGLAVICALLLLNVLQWEAGLDAMVTSFIVTQLTVGGTIRKAMLRFAGALLGGLTALAVIIFIIPHIVSIQSITLVVAAVLFLCAYVYTGPERSAYAGLQAGMAFVMVLVSSSRQEISIMPAVNRLVGVMLGVGVSIAIESLIWPQHAALDLRARLRGALSDLAALFKDIARTFGTAVPRRPEWIARVHEIREKLDACAALFGEASLEGPSARERIAEDLPLVSAGEELLHRLARFASRFSRPVRAELLRELPALHVLSATIDDALERLPARIEGQRELPDDAAPLRAARSALTSDIESMRSEGRVRSFSTEDVERFLALVDALDHLAQELVALEERLASPRERTAQAA